MFDLTMPTRIRAIVGGLFPLLLAAAPATKAATFTAVATTPSHLITSSFESPPVVGEPGGYASPAGTNWTFTGGAGLAANGSSLGNATAPAGLQVGFVGKLSSGTLGSMTRSFTVTTPGRYRLSLAAAQAPSNAQIVRITVDSVEVGRVKPAGSSFEPFVFDALQLSSGTHQLTISAEVATANEILFVDNVRVSDTAAGSNLWSSVSTWDRGAVPGANDTVVIPADSAVRLNGVAAARSISVVGDLHCDDGNITLSAEQIMVQGRLICGSTFSPYTHAFALTLVTPAAPAPGDDDYKALMIMSPGVLELHGEARRSWTQLSATAAAGTGAIQVADATDWRVGDWIVIAPTDYAVESLVVTPQVMINQAEKAQITAIDPTGKTITLDTTAPNHLLQYLHYGQQRTYSKTSPSTTWTLDERAEVGLLTRNIRIQGDSASVSSGIGGHVMSMAGTQVHVSGVELFQMGQKNIRARYPFHWHLVGNAPGQYIRNSSIHASYNRCVTVHGTHDTLVEDNVCYDFVGHGYFLEDGIEQNNTFNHNLGVFARIPPTPSTPRADPYSFCPRFDGDPPDPVSDIPLPLETDYREGPNSSAASTGPSVFWISNPNNTYTDNAAAGSAGAGFWYHLDTVPTAESSQLSGACAVNPRAAPFGRFENNRVRASRQGFTSCFFGGNTLGLDTTGAVIEGLTVTNVGQGIWPCGAGRTHFHNAVIANTENGLQAPLPYTFSDSLFVAYSDNKPQQAARSVDLPWSAVWMYDQGFNFDNIHFVNYDQPAMSVFQRVGGAHKAASNRSSSLSFDNSPNVFRNILDAWAPGGQPATWGEVIHDLDGTLVGLGGDGSPRAFTSSHPLMVDDKCYREPGRGIDGYGCPYQYSTLMIDTLTPGLPFVPAPWITYQRSDGVHDTTQHGLITLRALHNFISNGSYRHSYRFVNGLEHNQYVIRLYWSRPGTEAIVELMDVPDTWFIHPGWASAFTEVSSIGALESMTTDSYYYRSDTSSVFFKLRAAGPDWEAERNVLFCIGSDPTCPAEPRNVDLPEVQITSPSDKERIAAAVSGKTTVTVTADLGSVVGLASAQLYSGSTLGARQTWSTSPLSASVSLTIDLPSGSHPLNLVVKDTLGTSYTTVQQIYVGDIDSRVEIDANGLEQNGTYFSTSVPNLQFTIANWSGGGRHAHWFTDKIDQGDVAVGNSVPLGSVKQGRHEVGVALADVDENVYPMRDQRTIFIVRNGMLADYEDGIDPRGSFVQHLPSGDVAQPIYTQWTPVRVSRDDNSDNDVNIFHLPATGFGGYTGTYTLSLQPALSFSSYSKLRISHAGPGFEVRLIYANGSPAAYLGNTTYTVPFATVDFTLPSPLAGDVAAIELRHLPNSPSCTPTCPTTQHLNSLQLVN